MGTKHNIVHISQCLEEFLKKNEINNNGYAARIYFSELVGHKLSKHCELVKISGHTAFISAKSPVVKNEVAIIKRKICKGLNEFFGKEKIKEIKILYD